MQVEERENNFWGEGHHLFIILQLVSSSCTTVVEIGQQHFATWPGLNAGDEVGAPTVKPLPEYKHPLASQPSTMSNPLADIGPMSNYN